MQIRDIFFTHSKFVLFWTPCEWTRCVHFTILMNCIAWASIVLLCYYCIMALVILCFVSLRIFDAFVQRKIQRQWLLALKMHFTCKLFRWAFLFLYKRTHVCVCLLFEHENNNYMFIFQRKKYSFLSKAKCTRYVFVPFWFILLEKWISDQKNRYN